MLCPVQNHAGPAVCLQYCLCRISPHTVQSTTGIYIINVSKLALVHFDLNNVLAAVFYFGGKNQRFICLRFVSEYQLDDNTLTCRACLLHRNQICRSFLIIHDIVFILYGVHISILF